MGCSLALLRVAPFLRPLIQFTERTKIDLCSTPSPHRRGRRVHYQPIRCAEK